MHQNNYSIVLFLQYSPFGLDQSVIGYTEAEVYVKRPTGKYDWVYYLKTHLVTRIETDILEGKFKNHSLPTKIIKREGNNFILQAISMNNQEEHRGRLIKIETKAEIIPDIEKLIEKLFKCVNKIRSIQGDKSKSPEEKEELLKSTEIEIEKLLEVLGIGSLVFEKKKLESLILNLEETKEAFQEEPPIDIPKKLIFLIGEYKKQLQELNYFEAN